MAIKPKTMIVDNATIYVAPSNVDLSKIDDIVSACVEANRLGLGKDKIKFSAKPSITQYDFAGRKDKAVKEMQEVSAWEVSLEGDCLDFNETVLKANMLKKTTATSTTHEVYAAIEGEIPADCYLDILVAGRVFGSTDKVIIALKNCLGSEFGLEFGDKDNIPVPLNLKPHYSIETLNNIPFKIITNKATA